MAKTLKYPAPPEDRPDDPTHQHAPGHHWRRDYVAPDNWHREPPCTCGGCPVCDTWTQVREVLSLDVTDNGLCFTGDSLSITMPDITTVSDDWCFSFRNGIMGQSNFRTYESLNGGGVHFMVNGFEWDAVHSTMPAGETCICYLDATHWLVTGDATGGGGT